MDSSVDSAEAAPGAENSSAVDSTREPALPDAPPEAAPTEASGQAHASSPEGGQTADTDSVEVSITEIDTSGMHDEHTAYVTQLKDAGLLVDLTEAMLHVLEEAVEDGPEAHHSTRDQRAVSLLHAYYTASGDEDASKRRIEADRFFPHANEDLVDAHGIVDRLNELVPEVPEVHLERIGGGAEGPLVLRSGEDFSAVTDDYEEDLDADDIDLRGLDMIETISVRALVGALNGLLARTEFNRRFIMLQSDGAREVYVAVPSECALSLLHGGLLDRSSEEWLVDFCAF